MARAPRAPAAANSFSCETIDKMTGRHSKPADIAARTKVRLGISGSPVQALTGMWLPAAYKTHFGKDAGISRNQRGVLGGPICASPIRHLLI